MAAPLHTPERTMARTVYMVTIGDYRLATPDITGNFTDSQDAWAEYHQHAEAEFPQLFEVQVDLDGEHLDSKRLSPDWTTDPAHRLIRATICPDDDELNLGEVATRDEALAVLGGWFLSEPSAAFMHPRLRCTVCDTDISNLDPCPCEIAEAAPVVTRRPRYSGYTELGDWDSPGEDYVLLADGEEIGGTYWCGANYIADGQRWASHGPAGLSMKHRTREDAEQVQVAAYLAGREPARVDPVAAAIREFQKTAACPVHPGCNPLRHCPARDGRV